jgi:hypothetical protein
MKRPIVSRRAMLRGAGGVAIGLPWLAATSETARAQTAPLPRLVVFSVGHSVDVTRGQNSWLPGASWDALSPVLEPLVPLRDRLLLLSGIDNLVSSSGIVPSNGHNFSSRSLLTAMPTRECLDGAGNLLQSRPQCQPNSAAGGPSFEHLVGNLMRSDVLGLRVGERPGEHARSFRMDGTLDEGQASPAVAFDRTFAGRPTGGGQPGTVGTPAEQLRARRGSVLDAVREQFRVLTARLGAEDRARLDRHANHIRELETRLVMTTKIVCENPRLNAPLPLPTGPYAFEQSEGRSDDAIAAAHVDLIATSLACQATRVAHLHMANKENNTFAFLNGGRDLITDNWHGIVHMEGGGDQDRLVPMRWYSKLFGDLLNRLAGTPEGPGTLLDNTVVLFISSLRTNLHGTNDLPIILAGNAAGRLRTGRHIRYTPARTTGDLFTTLLGVLGLPTTTPFGWNRGTAPGGRPFYSGLLTGWAG